MTPETTPWPSVADPADTRELCPQCHADQGHEDFCPFYLPLCATCHTRAVKREGGRCKECRPAEERAA